MMPFLILLALSLAGIVRILMIFSASQTISLLLLPFWLIRNLYFLSMALFLVDGRDNDEETVKVIDAEPVTLHTDLQQTYEGVTTFLTEHNLMVFLDNGEILKTGTPVTVTISADTGTVTLKGIIIGIRHSRHSEAMTHMIEILDFHEKELDYLQILYDRIPTLPQSLQRDFGVVPHLWQNIAHRVARTGK